MVCQNEMNENRLPRFFTAPLAGDSLEMYLTMNKSWGRNTSAFVLAAILPIECRLFVDKLFDRSTL